MTDAPPTLSLPAPSQAEALAPIEQLYEEHFAFVWRVARRLGVPEAALDDAVQEVFLVAHRRRESFEGRATVRSWLYGIVRRVARDHRATRRERLDADGVVDRPSPATAHDAVERAEALRILHRLLDGLDDDRREVFVLAELEQMPMPEVAALLGLNVNTAHARLRAARQSMEQGIARLRAQQSWRSP